jgi:ketosteroid isomerase-like protein
MKANDTNLETVSAVLAAITDGKLDVALNNFEESAKWRCADALPESGTHDGKKAIGAMLTRVRERYRNKLHLLGLTVYAGDGHVFAEYTRSGTSDAYGPGSEHVLAVFEVVLGKIREAREFVFRRTA